MLVNMFLKKMFFYFKKINFQEDFFYFLKIIFDISTSKWSENTKKILI